MQVTGYTGHGKSGGLQQHSMGDMYPYTVIRKGKDASVFCAMDCRTGKEGNLRLSYEEARADAAALLIRNMMHG